MKYSVYVIIFMVGALLQGFGTAVGAIQQQKGIEDSIYAQQLENEKNRRYNFMLAQKQNEWNIQQWERSNAYNNPLNQMNRLKVAKLNPNLVYGNGAGQSVAAPNPQMTSGAPSTPQDMSLLSQRPTVGQVINDTLQNRVVQAQIAKTEADTRKTLADAGISETQLEYEDAKQLIGLDLMRQTFDKNSREWQVLGEAVKQAKLQTQGLEYDVAIKRIDNMFRERQVNAIVSDLENKAKISKNEAEYLLETLSLRIAGLDYDVSSKKYESQFHHIFTDSNSDQILKLLTPVVPFLRKLLFGS